MMEGMRVSSAGYRLPERSDHVATDRTMIQSSVAAQRPLNSKPRNTRGDTDTRRSEVTSDSVKQDQVWRDLVRVEKKGVKEWEKNWSFLKDYDYMGRPKPEKPQPSEVSVFSERLPNTTNHMFGSRMDSPLSQELMRMDRLLLWTGTHHHKCKPDREMFPC